MIVVKWDEPDPGGAPVSREKSGIVVGWVLNHAVVMIDNIIGHNYFKQVPLMSLRFVGWHKLD